MPNDATPDDLPEVVQQNLLETLKAARKRFGSQTYFRIIRNPDSDPAEVAFLINARAEAQKAYDEELNRSLRGIVSSIEARKPEIVAAIAEVRGTIERLEKIVKLADAVTRLLNLLGRSLPLLP